ncbi:MAG TPA: hypothetical protein VMM14_07730 [Acidimicrobiia bacterium]|nr:hypothetical protein [Acidimicrobiia bacterium]
MATWKLTDHDAERVLSGSGPEDIALARLHATLAALHRLEVVSLPEEQVGQLVARAAALSRDGNPVAARPAGTGPDHYRKGLRALRHRLALAGAAILLISGMTGVAVASDEAVPGDRLYGLDRALERVGIGVGGAAERISEAQTLANFGQMTAAINHAAEAVEESEIGEEFSPEAFAAATALRNAAESVSGDNDDPESQQVRDAVAAMLGEMADMAGDPDFDGESFGRRVSELARSIGDRGVEGSGVDDQPGRPDRARGDENAGPPSQVPGGPPEGTPGDRSGGAGRP